jgi:hypothetical protein
MISTVDISSVTDRIVDYLTIAVTNWLGWNVNGGSLTPFNIQVSGSMPEAVRNLAGCQMTIYLFHLNAEPFTRNTPLGGSQVPPNTQAQPNIRQALGLTLYYLLTAFDRDSTTHEQQAMSIAINALHAHGTYVDPVDGFTFTITLDPEKADEANRRWQSYSTVFRLSAVYRVGVVFLSPTVIPPVPFPAPQRIGLSLAPMSLPFAGAGALTSTASRVDFSPLNPLPGDTIVYDYSPAVSAPGGFFSVFGAGLDQPTAKRLYVLSAGLEVEVTSWKAAPVQNTAATRVVVNLPKPVGGMPASSPVPGVYQLRVGSDTAKGDGQDYRSNSTPLLISARVDAPGLPWNPVAGVFSFTGDGFIAGATELLLDTVALRVVAGSPAPGEFQIVGGTVNFQPGTPTGTYFVRLRVNGVEGPPVGRIVLS